MPTSPDFAIVGGGIIGLTTAYFLAREGCRVTVLDKGDLGQEASWAGAGILPAVDLAHARTPLEQLQGQGVRLFPELSRQLHDATGIDNGYRRSGGLELLDFASPGHTEEWRGDTQAAGPLSVGELAQLEPRLAAHLGPTWHLPGMAQVRNPRHLRALQSACLSLKVVLQPLCPVRSFERAGKHITGLITPEGKVQAAKFLITTGAWTDELLASMGWQPGIRPIRGQMVLLSAPALPLQRILLAGARYLVPRGDGFILVGSTEEDAGFEKRNTAVAIQELLTLACRLVPDLAQATIERTWSGLRPGSPDGLPFIGNVPACDNLFVAAGHFRAGILLSPGTALVMKELLLDQPTTVPLEAFRPERKKSEE